MARESEQDDEDDFDEDDARAEAAAAKLREPLPPLTDVERACNVGDLLKVIAPFESRGWDDPTPTRIEPAGQIYRAARLFSRGWDFELVSGDTPKEVRIMNWDVKKVFQRPAPW